MAHITIWGLVYEHARVVRICAYVCVRVWQTLVAGLKLKPYAERSS